MLRTFVLSKRSRVAAFAALVFLVPVLAVSAVSGATESWFQVGADIDGEASGGESGYAVALSSDGTTVAIGAPFNDENGHNAGHVRVFNNVESVWTQVGDDIDGEAVGNQSGGAVALSSDSATVAIGARFNNGNSCLCRKTISNNKCEWLSKYRNWNRHSSKW